MVILLYLTLLALLITASMWLGVLGFVLVTKGKPFCGLALMVSCAFFIAGAIRIGQWLNQ